MLCPFKKSIFIIQTFIRLHVNKNSCFFIFFMILNK